MAQAAPAPVQPAPPLVVEQRNEQGQLVSRTELGDGVPNGLMTTFGPDGKPTMQAGYRAGVLHGTSKLWDEQGQLVQEAAYQQGRQQGLTRVYAGGRLLSEQMFAQGLLHGETVFYSEAGEPTCKMHFRQGQVEGEALFFNEGGLVRRAIYRKGLLEGECIDYDREGTRVQSAHYKANLLDGWLRRYWPNGQVMEELQYKQGKPVGKPRRFNSKGAKQAGEAAQASLMQRLEKLVRG
jgi:antitoxin component YwqK of YwqJK toxin-antitoxin module